ncbi:hypothetical protein [Salisediminibacterium halotolerans]|uniref:tRNA_anti-like n=1 Tax=Salisediminibacterium halotolerans TaxID=517425 RepID=A0A1H9TSC0_9BACI|nr:hypothetical protein [Salisediminibacterium haloalkalitolerans]SER99928.1 hypothetical protein SAMN05444126_1117 [Salisediminibacterium haloalkalitolerans]
MAVIFGLLFFGAFIMLILSLIRPSWAKVESRKQGLLYYVPAFILFFVLAGSLADSPDTSEAENSHDDNNNETENEENEENNQENNNNEEDENEENNNSNEENAIEEEEEDEPEEIAFEFTSHEYNEEDETYDFVVETDLPDDTDVTISLQEIEEDSFEVYGYMYNGAIESYEVENGQIDGSIEGAEDDWDGPFPIANGEWYLTAAITVMEDDDSYNPHLYDEYGSYEELTENYLIDAELEDTDSGWTVGNLDKQTVEINNAHTVEEIEDMQAEFRKGRAEEIPYGELEKNPDALFGEYVTYSGEVLEITEQGALTILRLALDDYASEVIWVEYEGRTDAISEDDITIYGEVYGSHTYESQAGWMITVPAVMADNIEID